jgi:hypothetical protein
MNMDKSLVKRELGWSLYFIILSYILVGLYSSFNPLNYTILPFHFRSFPEWDIILYPKWLVIISLFVLFQIGKCLYLIAPAISPKAMRAIVYIVSFGFYLVPIIMCIDLVYIKRNFEKKALTNVFEYSAPDATLANTKVKLLFIK